MDEKRFNSFAPGGTLIVRRWTAVLTAVAVAAGLSGCAATAVDSPAASIPAGRSAFGHVHGIGIDPTSGGAFAATHAGVFRLPPLDAEAVPASEVEGPIAGRAQDTMGFTMASGLMFGSGHPDPTEEPVLNPPNLGLITSSDEAATWTSVSLRGQTDFHDLAVAADGPEFRIYGYDEMAGVVRVSADSGKTWTTGAQIVARDLSVDPSKPDTVYATTARGLAVSTDGARTFALVPNAPALYLVDSLNDKSGGLIGVDVDGTIWVNQDGTTWTSTGTINGVTEALTYASAPSARLVVATEEGILASTDQGATWRDVVVN